MSDWLLFARPFLLALLVFPVALAIWTWKRRGREVAVPLDEGIQGSGMAWWRAIGVFETMPALLLAVAIIILAGPQEVGQPRNRRALSNIEFCVDISGSMTASFGERTRYEASMEAIREFVEFREGDAFGLTFFSNTVMNWVPLTTDTSAFEYALPFMDPRRPLPPGLGAGTEIGKALQACRRTLLEREEGDRMIILVSDGASADLSGGRDAEIARSLQEAGIVVYDIHVADGEIPEEIVNIAYLTDGEAFQPGNDESLAAVFRRIDGMQKTKLEKVAAETRDRFKPWAVAGLGLLGLCGVGLLGLRYTPW